MPKFERGAPSALSALGAPFAFRCSLAADRATVRAYPNSWRRVNAVAVSTVQCDAHVSQAIEYDGSDVK